MYISLLCGVVVSLILTCHVIRNVYSLHSTSLYFKNEGLGSQSVKCIPAEEHDIGLTPRGVGAIVSPQYSAFVLPIEH